MSFTPAETIQELTMDKLKETIRYVYEPYGMLNNVSEDYYIKVMYYLKEKHRNLKWLLGDKLRIPVEAKHTQETLDEETLNELKFLISNSMYTIDNLLETPELIKELIENTIVSPITVKNALSICPSLLLGYHISNSLLTKDAICQASGNNWNSTVFTSINFKFYKASKITSSGATVSWLSMEPADILLAANSGAVRSCHRVDGGHHSGSVSNMLADFALVHYLGSKRYTFSGRQWVWLPMTKRGIPYESPLIKFQKRYGTVQDFTVRFAISTILSKFGQAFGFNPKDFVVDTSVGLDAYSMSQVYGRGIAYLDTTMHTGTPWVFYKSKPSGSFRPLRFDHPLPIGFSGKSILNGEMYKRDERTVIQEIGIDLGVIVDHNGIKRAATDCYNIDGKIVSIEELIANFDGTSKPIEVKPVVEPESSKPTHKVEQIDIDVEDF